MKEERAHSNPGSFTNSIYTLNLTSSHLLKHVAPEILTSLALIISSYLHAVASTISKIKSCIYPTSPPPPIPQLLSHLSSPCDSKIPQNSCLYSLFLIFLHFSFESSPIRLLCLPLHRSSSSQVTIGPPCCQIKWSIPSPHLA